VATILILPNVDTDPFKNHKNELARVHTWTKATFDFEIFRRASMIWRKSGYHFARWDSDSKDRIADRPFLAASAIKKRPPPL
jgi:hypothetical protein